MKKKVGTLLDSDLLKRAKRLAAAKGDPLNEIIEKALEAYLQQESGDELLSLEEVLEADPASRSSEGSGRGAGEIGDQDFD